MAERMKISDEHISDVWQGRPTLADIERRYAPAVSMGWGADGSESEAYKAQDAALRNGGHYSMLLHSLEMVNYNTVPQFVGYGVLTGLTQNGLIRAGVSMIADEMTREWIELKRDGDNAGSVAGIDPIKAIEAEFDRLNVRAVFKQAMEYCGFYGGCLVYIDTGETDPHNLRYGLASTEYTVKQGSIKSLIPIEPSLVSPGAYNSTEPWRKDYFVPRSWLIQGREIHADRFLYFSINPVPTLLRPSYNFFGVPTAQIVLDVVDHFTECREAEARLLTKFSMTVLKTDMSAFLTGGTAEMIRKRIQYMAQNRDNDAIIAINAGDMNTGGEDIIKLETPLSGVTDIVRQSMEMVAAYFREPVVKLWGISPGGFNATGEIDLQNHYDNISAQQNAVFRKPLERMIELVQLNSTGSIDKSVTFDFAPLSRADERTTAEVQKLKADGDAVLIAAGIISQEEARKRLADDPDSGYNSIDIDAAPMTAPELEL